MLSNDYESQQIISLVESLLAKKTEGVLTITTKVANWQQQKRCSLVLQHNQLIFADVQLLDSLELAQKLGNKLNPNSINAALLVAQKRVANAKSHQEFINLLIKMKRPLA